MSAPLSNRRVVMAARPGGLPVAGDFRLERTAVPQPGDGEVLLRIHYLSLDPYMRNLMDAAGTSYAPPIAVGAPMVGGTVGEVVASRHPDWPVGSRVLSQGGWQDYTVSDGSDLSALGTLAQPSWALGALGMPAFTAYVGLLDIGRPRTGETVVVAAATGGVGAMVGQIARLQGARVVGIAGGAEKCRHAVETLGFDACLDRHEAGLPERLAQACPDGIDVYFENVGGDVLDAVVPLLNHRARVPVCGFIAHYNDEAAAGPDRLPALMTTLLQKRVRMEGFIILDHYAQRYDAFRRDMAAWLAHGDVRVLEHRVDGLERAPGAFIDMLQGRNFGKVVVHVAADA